MHRQKMRHEQHGENAEPKAADALHEADNVLTTLQAQLNKDSERLREMNIQPGETERQLKGRIGDLEARAKQIRSAIDERRKVCANLSTQIEKSHTTVEDGQRRLAALLEAAEQ